MEKKLDAHFIIHEPFVKKPGELTRAIFGMSIDELAKDIYENKDGKYDWTYEQPNAAGVNRDDLI